MKHFRSHGWSAEISRETDRQSYVEVTAQRKDTTIHIAILYSSSEISNSEYMELSKRVNHIFFRGQPYMLDNFAKNVPIPVESLDNFFSFLINMNKKFEPDRSPPVVSSNPARVRRLTAENPLDAVLGRLQAFTSEALVAKLVTRRAKLNDIALSQDQLTNKAIGVAYSMRNALDYLVSTSNNPLNKRVLGLYYGAMALAQAEMLASPSGAIDLDAVERMTTRGHGLYALPGPNGGFADLRVGVLGSGFLPKWVDFLGYDTADYPKKRPRSFGDLDTVPRCMVCSLQDLFSTMPEIDDLFTDVFEGQPGWISVVNDNETNPRQSILNPKPNKIESTYGLFIDKSGKVPITQLENAGWPLAEIQQVDSDKREGTTFRARVDHVGHDIWWAVLPTHSSSFISGNTLIFPAVGGIRQYRIIAFMTMYALSIMTRYMPSTWRRIEGGDEDKYLALVKAALTVWERLLPEHFLESISGERFRTVQPGSFFA